MSELCLEKMSAVAGGGFIYCNSMKGHVGPHAHTYPTQLFPVPQTEMVSLREIRAALARTESTLNGINIEVGTNSKIMDAFLVRLEAVEQSQGKLLAALNELDGRVRGLGDGLADKLNYLDLEIPHCINTKIDRSHADLQQGLISINNRLDMIASRLPLAATPPRRKSSRRKKGERK